MTLATVFVGVVVVVLLVVVLRFETIVLTDIARAESTRMLPPIAWGVLAIITIPLGGILYWVYGREDIQS
ncbi:MAG: hypothetical protein QOG52_2616 [Frankiaceae bacterium]|jgi:hypothetical protein|nr:hypothetical protein [Frankiaceae bacterium]